MHGAASPLPRVHSGTGPCSADADGSLLQPKLVSIGHDWARGQLLFAAAWYTSRSGRMTTRSRSVPSTPRDEHARCYPGPPTRISSGRHDRTSGERRDKCHRRPVRGTTEAIGGYVVLAANGLDTAIELVSRIPAARLGGHRSSRLQRGRRRRPRRRMRRPRSAYCATECSATRVPGEDSVRDRGIDSIRRASHARRQDAAARCVGWTGKTVDDNDSRRAHGAGCSRATLRPLHWAGTGPMDVGAGPDQGK
jgi:hypothetical protein